MQGPEGTLQLPPDPEVAIAPGFPGVNKCSSQQWAIWNERQQGKNSTEHNYMEVQGAQFDANTLNKSGLMCNWLQGKRGGLQLHLHLNTAAPTDAGGTLEQHITLTLCYRNDAEILRNSNAALLGKKHVDLYFAQMCTFLTAFVDVHVP